MGLALAQVAGHPGVLAAVVTSPDGLPVTALRATDEPVGDPDAWAAVSTALGSLAHRLSRAAKRGDLASAVFQAEQRWVLVRPLAIGFLVVVSNTELTAHEFEAAAREVERATRTLTGAEGNRRHDDTG